MRATEAPARGAAPRTGFDVVVRRLAGLGYERVEHQVRDRGEFAVRGGLIDVYPSLGDPLRIEFWGDEVESIRTFSVYSQRTSGSLDAATVFAAFEADTELPEYKTGVHQAIGAWEAEGREEAPDELYRRAGVRALAALSGRFTTSRTWSREGGQRVAVFNPDEVVRALADFTAELDTVDRQAAARTAARRRAASGSTCRSPRPAPCSPRRCSSTSCSATSRCASTPRARSSPAATSPAPSAT